MFTARLAFTPLTAEQLLAFHDLVTDPHIRRYMMDGQILSREWAAEQIAASLVRFEASGTGLWLASVREGGGSPIGFCGFMTASAAGLGPELVYALREASTGAGLATEMAQAMIAHARAQPGFEQISASVDAVNARSVRILEKLGFRRVEIRQGAFGDMLVLALETRSRGENVP
jgi:[ribosomal protein S5]-alanine N-acetyltransferase